MIPHRVQILGTPVDALSRDGVRARVDGYLRGGALHHIVTANPEFLLHAAADARIRSVMEHASLVVPDGVGLLWVSRFYGAPLPERVAGVDLLIDIARGAARGGRVAYFLGGREGVAVGAARAVSRIVPGLGAAAFDEDHDAEHPPARLWSDLERVRPTVLYVAYGAPQQELWIDTHRTQLEACGVRVAIGVGGALDILSGRLPRAPRWVRVAGCEWLWRLLLQPSRFPRVVRATVVFPVAVLRDRAIRRSAV